LPLVSRGELEEVVFAGETVTTSIPPARKENATKPNAIRVRVTLRVRAMCNLERKDRKIWPGERKGFPLDQEPEIQLRFFSGPRAQRSYGLILGAIGVVV
jgi:hypothetical protein